GAADGVDRTAVAAGEVVDHLQDEAGDEVQALGVQRDALAVEEHLGALPGGEDELAAQKAFFGDQRLQPGARVHPHLPRYNTRLKKRMSSMDRPPSGGPLKLDDDPQATGPARGEVVSLAALWTARLLRLRPHHGPRPTGQRVRDSLELPRWALSLSLLLLMLL